MPRRVDKKQRYSLRVIRHGVPIGEYVFNATILGVEQLKTAIKPEFSYDILSESGTLYEYKSTFGGLWEFKKQLDKLGVSHLFDFR